MSQMSAKMVDSVLTQDELKLDPEAFLPFSTERAKVDSFWNALGDAQQFYTKPTLRESVSSLVKASFVMSAKPGYCFDPEFWDLFSRYPFQIEAMVCDVGKLFVSFLCE